MVRPGVSAGGWLCGMVLAAGVCVATGAIAGGVSAAAPDQAGGVEPAQPLPTSAPVAGTDAHLRAAIREGYDRSLTFRALVDHLADHHATVHLHWAPGLAPGLQACLLHHVAMADDGARLLWVFVRHNEPSDLLISLIAHELHHVHEALDAGVRSGPEMEWLFRRIGERVGSSGRARNYPVYETQGALESQDRVKRELRLTRSAGRAVAR